MVLIGRAASRSGRPRNGRNWSGSTGDVVSLGRGARGLKGVVVGVGGGASHRGEALDQAEMERRLLEIGFVEGANVEILHEGAIGRDPIAVKLDDMRVALRRREANAVLVRVADDEGWLEAAE